MSGFFIFYEPNFLDFFMASFFDIDMESHLGDDNQLIKLNKLIDWSKFSKHLENIHQKTERADGPKGYNPLKMFKCLLLSQWHSLSDPGLEESLRVRLDFLKFTGFSVGDKLPDETSFCRFRNKLIEQDKLDYFHKINVHLFCKIRSLRGGKRSLPLARFHTICQFIN
jgi:IS5 family transposase